MIDLRFLGTLEIRRPANGNQVVALTQPKRLALLLYLALAEPSGLKSRESLMALLWPDGDDESARHSLRNALYGLRQTLGDAALISRGEGYVGFDPSAIHCDALELRRLVAERRWEDAVTAWGGDLAPGFHVSEAPEFDHWLDDQRTGLRRIVTDAAWRRVDEMERSGDAGLVPAAQRAWALEPANEAGARRLMRFLDASVGRAAALRAYDELADYLRRECEAEPSAETRALAGELKARVEAPVPLHPRALPATSPLPAPHIIEPDVMPSGPSSQRRRSRMGGIAGLLLVGALLAVAATVAINQRQPGTIVIGKRIAVAAGRDREVFPSISPDGNTVSYTVETSTTRKLFVQQVDGGSPVPVATQLSGWQENGTFSPDGTRLLFAAPEGLYVMPALGGAAHLFVPRGATDFVKWGSWAPDGKQIAYVQGDTLFIQSLDSTIRAALAAGPDLHSPAWSPDGDWVAFVSGNPGFSGGNIAPSAMRLVRSVGGPVLALSDSRTLNTSPIWVPGKRAILFISDRDGGRDVYQLFLTRSGAPAGTPVRLTTGLNPERISMSADGTRLAWSVVTRAKNIWSLPIPAHDSLPLSQARQETSGTQQIENFSVSLDGQWLYYDSSRKGNQDIWRKAFAGGEPEMITTDPADDFQPAVSPDGREVAFHSMRTGNRDIFVVPVVGGPAFRISTSQGPDNDVTWSPDGRKLIWSSDEGDSSAWTARRADDGSWGSPTHLPLGPAHSLRMLRWSPDNHWIFFSDSAGLELWSPHTGERRLLVHGVTAEYVAWSEDGWTMYGLVYQRALDRVALVAVTVADGRVKVIAYADNPRSQEYGSGFAVRNGRIYFTLTDDRSDIWMGDVTIR